MSKHLTDAQMLEALVEYARKDGDAFARRKLVVSTYSNGVPGIIEYEGVSNQFVRTFDWQSLVFSHDFARAVFGEKLQPLALISPNPDKSFWENLDREVLRLPAYKARLMAAVTSNNPIKYMYEAVFGN